MTICGRTVFILLIVGSPHFFSIGCKEEQEKISEIREDLVQAEPEVVHQIYYPNGVLKESGLYRQQQKVGEWVEYYESGNIKKRGAYAENKMVGKWVAYHESGVVWHEGVYESDKMEGEWIWYNGRGSNSKGMYSSGEMDGKWVWTNEHGSITKIGIYDNGQEVNIVDCKVNPAECEGL